MPTFVSTLSDADELAIEQERARFILQHGVHELRFCGGRDGIPLRYVVTIAEQPHEVQYSMLAAGIKVPKQEPEPVSEPSAEIHIDDVVNRIDTTTEEEDDRILAKINAKRAAKKSGALFPEVAEEIEFTEKRMEPTEDEFQAFWDAYPRKVEKKRAKAAFVKAFRSLRKTLSPEAAVAKIMQGVSVYSRNANQDALCHPTTWLNGERWEDDPAGIGTPDRMARRAENAMLGAYEPREKTPISEAVF